MLWGSLLQVMPCATRNVPPFPLTCTAFSGDSHSRPLWTTKSREIRRLEGQGWDWKCRRHTFHFSGRALACLGSQEPGRNPRLALQLRISASPIALLQTGIPQVHVGRVPGVCKRVCECVCIHAGVCMLECVYVSHARHAAAGSPPGNLQDDLPPSIPESIAGSGYS